VGCAAGAYACLASSCSASSGIYCLAFAPTRLLIICLVRTLAFGIDIPILLWPRHLQARSASWRGRRAGCSTTSGQWTPAQPTPPPTTTLVGLVASPISAALRVPASATLSKGLLPRLYQPPFPAGCVPRCRLPAGVAAGEAGRAAKAIEHYGTAVSRAALVECCIAVALFWCQCRCRCRGFHPVFQALVFCAALHVRRFTPLLQHCTCSSPLLLLPHPTLPVCLQVRLMPRYAEAWCNMGVLLKQQVCGRRTEHALYCSAVLHVAERRLWPGSHGCKRPTNAWVVQPTLCAHVCPQGELEKAIAAYEHALTAAPNLEVVQQNMAAALTEWGTHLKAAGAWL